MIQDWHLLSISFQSPGDLSTEPADSVEILGATPGQHQPGVSSQSGWYRSCITGLFFIGDLNCQFVVSLLLAM